MNDNVNKGIQEDLLNFQKAVDFITDEVSVESFIMISKGLSDRCDDERDHLMPLKLGFSKYDFFYPEAWNVPCEEKEQMMKDVNLLFDYARAIVYVGNFVMERADNPKIMELFQEFSLLPRWIVFPLYPRDTVGWRANLAADYVKIFHYWFSVIPEDVREEYCKKWPVPAYLINQVQLDAMNGQVTNRIFY